MSIKQEIVKRLAHLPLELQQRVLDFTQALVSSQPKDVPGKQLLRFAGTLRAEDSQAMIQAIETGCEQGLMKGENHGSYTSSQDS